MLELVALLIMMQSAPSSGSPPALIVFAETSCYGYCPDYRLALFPSDDYALCGFMFVNTRRVSTAALPGGTFSSASDLVLGAGLLDADPVVPGGAECRVESTDSPSIKLEVLFEDGTARSFSWYQGCHINRDGRPGPTAARAEIFLNDMRELIGFETLIQSEQTRSQFSREDLWRPFMLPQDCPIPTPIEQILD